MPWFNFQFNDFAVSFLSVLFEGIPYLLIGSLISGLVDVFVSPSRLARLLPSHPGAALCISGLLGMIFPMCECGSVVVIRRFLRKGLPVSFATTYMLAAPIFSPVVALSTWKAFSQSSEPGPLLMVCLRLGLGYLLAVAAGFLMHRFPRESVLSDAMLFEENAGRNTARRQGLSIAPDPAETVPRGLGRKLLLAVQSATGDFLDVAFFFVLGTALTCVFNTGVRQEVLTPFASSPLLSVLALMVLAALLALCSSTDAFVAWTFTAFSPGSKLAFLLFGPVFDLKLFWLYGLVFRRRVVCLIGIGFFAAIAILCWRLDALQIFGGGIRLPNAP
jgi:uncharacterized membrane protein YraQ (UPF0718 family)